MLFSEQFRSDPRDQNADRAASGVTPEEPPRRAGLRVATYNIHKGVSPWSRHNRIHDLRLSLHRLDADVVFLQEVQGRSERHAQRFANWPAGAQHDYLATAGWNYTAYGRNAMRVDGDHGNALLSRYPLLFAENINVSHHRFEQRGLLHCAFDFGGRSVHCLCAHFGLFEESRRHQAEALIERIRTTVPDDAPLIIAGDFNDWRNRLGGILSDGLGVREAFELAPVRDDHRHWLRRAPAQFLLGAQSKSSNPARTFPAVLPLLRLDRVYLRGLNVQEAAVMHGRGWRKLSDHAPIVTDLYLP